MKCNLLAIVGLTRKRLDVVQVAAVYIGIGTVVVIVIIVLVVLALRR